MLKLIRRIGKLIYFASLDKKLLDDEEFLFDVAKKACNNWGIPFGYASKRIKNNKLFALKACNISGSNLTDFNTNPKAFIERLGNSSVNTLQNSKGDQVDDLSDDNLVVTIAGNVSGGGRNCFIPLGSCTED